MKNEDLETRVARLAEKTQKLENSIQHSADTLEVMNLQYMYAHLIGIDFFRADNDVFVKDQPGTSEIVEGGIGVADVLPNRDGGNEPKYTGNYRGMSGMGTLGINPTGTGYVTINKDGKTAKGMWDQFAPHAMEVTPYPGDERKLTQFWFVGRYNNEFIKENGKWKCSKRQVLAFMRTPYDLGWLKQPNCRDQRFILENLKHEKHSPENLLSFYHSDGIFYLLPAPPEPEE